MSDYQSPKRRDAWHYFDTRLDNIEMANKWRCYGIEVGVPPCPASETEDSLATAFNREFHMHKHLPAYQSKEEMKQKVSSCTDCTKHKKDGFRCSLLVNPRYGLGPLGAKLAIIAQNPPADAARRLHGAFMLHYQGEKYEFLKGPHEKLVASLVQHLGLSAKEDVYATQAVKCATQYNEMNHELTHFCAARHLAPEMRMVNPRVVLCFGFYPSEALAGLNNVYWPWFVEDFFKCWADINLTSVGNSGSYMVKVRGSVIYAPHPSCVGRFIEPSSWMNAIRDAYKYVLAYTKEPVCPS